MTEPMPYLVTSLQGSTEVMRGSRALLGHMHSQRLSVQTVLVMIAMAQHGQAVSIDRLVEELGIDEPTVVASLGSLSRKGLTLFHGNNHFSFTEAGQIEVIAAINAVLLS